MSMEYFAWGLLTGGYLSGRICPGVYVLIPLIAPVHIFFMVNGFRVHMHGYVNIEGIGRSDYNTCRWFSRTSGSRISMV